MSRLVLQFVAKTFEPRLSQFSGFFIRFPQLGYAYDALKLGGAASIVLNAANEIGVEAFIQGKIGFTDIARLCHAMMYGFQPPTPTNLEEILKTDKEARKLAQSWLEGFCDKLEN